MKVRSRRRKRSLSIVRNINRSAWRGSVNKRGRAGAGLPREICANAHYVRLKSGWRFACARRWLMGTWGREKADLPGEPLPRHYPLFHALYKATLLFLSRLSITLASFNLPLSSIFHLPAPGQKVSLALGRGPVLVSPVSAFHVTPRVLECTGTSVRAQRRAQTLLRIHGAVPQICASSCSRRWRSVSRSRPATLPRRRRCCFLANYASPTTRRLRRGSSCGDADPWPFRREAPLSWVQEIAYISRQVRTATNIVWRSWRRRCSSQFRWNFRPTGISTWNSTWSGLFRRGSSGDRLRQWEGCHCLWGGRRSGPTGGTDEISMLIWNWH